MRSVSAASAHMKPCITRPNKGPRTLPRTPYARGYITLEEVVEKVARMARRRASTCGRLAAAIRVAPV